MLAAEDLVALWEADLELAGPIPIITSPPAVGLGVDQVNRRFADAPSLPVVDGPRQGRGAARP